MISAADGYRRRWPKLADAPSRREKAAKIAAVLRAYDERELAGLTCLDLGCGSGIIAAGLAPYFARLIACDLDPDGVAFAHAEFSGPNVTHLVADATLVPLADKSFDVIVCSHVYEHVSSAERLVAEIGRLLKPDGVCFFGGPNALRLYEPHLKMWLVHWLPRPLIDLILGAMGRPPYGEHLRNHRGLVHLLRDFAIQDVTLALVKDSEHFHTASEPGLRLAG
ncbi:MAG: class I SAM-dependent methyltransferase, partial [Candidatus Dormibacteraceae bacterium]